MSIVNKRTTLLHFIPKDDPFCTNLAAEFARSPIHRNRVHTVSHFADKALEGKPGRILEVGCGLGNVTYPLAQAGMTVTGIDIDLSSIEAARGRYQHPRISFECMDVADAYIDAFDVIVLTEVLEHVRLFHSFLHSITDRMSHGTGLILTVPNGSCWSERMCRPSYWLKTKPFGKAIVKTIKRILRARDVTTANELTPHVNFFSLPQLEQLFHDCGLTVKYSHGSFVLWPITETFFSERELNEKRALADYLVSQSSDLHKCVLWSFLLKKC